MIPIKKESAWQFVTSSSGGIGVEFVLAEGGAIYLRDPSGGLVTFRYGAAGAGVAAGFKLPKIGKLQFRLRGKNVGAAVAPAAFPNVGKLYILDWFPGNELTRSDLTGVCMFAEAGGGLFVGGSGTAMLLGMSPAWWAGTLASAPLPPLMVYTNYKMFQSATAVLLMAGINAGLMAGVGAGALVGGLV